MWSVNCQTHAPVCICSDNFKWISQSDPEAFVNLLFRYFLPIVSKNFDNFISNQFELSFSSSARNLHLPASLRLCQAQKSHRHARPQNLSLVTNPLPIREQIPCSQIRKILQMTKWSLETVHLVQIYKFFLLFSSGKNYYFDTVHFSDRDLEKRALFSIPEVILAFT